MYWGLFKMQKYCLRILSLFLVVVTVVSCLPLSASAKRSWDTVQSEIGKNAYGSEYLENYGMSRESLVNWLSSHEHDNYYLGTRYISGDFQSPNGDTSYNGMAGLNCSGFVAHACRMAGLNETAMMEYMRKGDIYYWGSGRYYDAMAGASNWYLLLQYSNLRAYVYSDLNSMLYSGHLEKGDLILGFTDKPSSLPYGQDNHLMIYWGDYVGDNKAWQSTHANVIEPINNLSYRNYIIIKTSPEKSLTISKSNLSLSIGSSSSISAKVTPSSLSVKWSSSNTNVVKVSSGGQLTTVGIGKATITAKSSDGSMSAKCEVIVGNPQVKSFSAMSRGCNSIKVYWSTNSACTGYKIYRSTSKNGTYSLRKTIKKNTTSCYYDTYLSFNKTYYYKVVPYTVYKNKTYSGNSSTIRSARTTMWKPSAHVTVSGGILKFTWNKVERAKYYEVWCSGYSSVSGFKLVKTTKSPVFKRGNLKKSGAYYYKIRAYTVQNGKKIYGSFSNVYTIDMSNPSIDNYYA